MPTTTQAGQRELDLAAENLAARVPEPLSVLARIAYNYAWSWHPDGPAVFEAVDPERWRRTNGNPVRLLQEAPWHALRRAAEDGDLLARAARVDEWIREQLERPPMPGPVDLEHPVAYFCAEFGVHASLPIYSGGLGALAGDVVKEASDLALPLVAVGLMYRAGYFRQRIDAHGWQQEYWVDTDPDRLPAALVCDDDGRPLTVSVPVRGDHVVAQIWRVDVGRVPLFLLDTERPENTAVARWITSQLYVGDGETRLSQYAVLGIGGMRLLRALGIGAGIVHLNEGHAAFASLDHDHADEGTPLDDRLARARERTVFTTHTPVPAGNDAYSGGEIADLVQGLAAEQHVDIGGIVRLGRTHQDNEHDPFGISQLALRTSHAANGVSRRHGEVARDMWHELWPDAPADQVPITHVTNGVHVPTWLGGPMREMLDRHFGEGWLERADDPQTWAPVDDIPAAELWDVRNRQRAALIDFLRDRAATDRLWRGDLRPYVEAAERAFHPEVLTIGFARRVATYKRLQLLTREPERALRLLSSDRPIQIVLAGKAHPRDNDAKRLVAELFALRGVSEAVAERVIFLHDYDLAIASKLVQGCDIWLNVPRPPLEASGTSGMKSAINGGLQLSVLDGWWAEGYDGSNGWALSGEVDHDHEAQDARHAAQLYDLLEGEVPDTFYERGEDGIPPRWVERMRASLRTNGPMFSATRMMREYTEKLYG